MGRVTRQIFVTSEDLLPKYDHGPTSIILGRNLVKKKKTKPENKKSPSLKRVKTDKTVTTFFLP